MTPRVPLKANGEPHNSRSENSIRGTDLARRNCRISVLGFGAIGSSIATSLARGDVDGASLVGVITRNSTGIELPFRHLSLDEAIAASDLIIECAGVEAVTNNGPRVVSSGKDLLLTSIGALSNPEIRELLFHNRPGRTFLTTGAIGGLDLLAAAAESGGLDSVTLTTTKKASTLIQPWMPPTQVEELHTCTRPVTVFEGDVHQAIDRFPKSLNVAVALAVATGIWDKFSVRMLADPAAKLTRHEILAQGAAGQYSFSVSNLPHEKNPATSKLVPAAILTGLSRLLHPSGTFI